MTQAPASLVLVLLAAALLSVFVAGWSLSLRRRVPIEPFSALMVCVAIYTAGSSAEIAQQSTEGMLAAVRFEYVGLSFIPPLFLIVSLQLFRQRRVSPLLWLALLVMPVITLVVALTMPLHDLFYVAPQAVPGEAFTVLEFDRGPWYVINSVQQAALVITATAFLLRFALRVRRDLRWAGVLTAVAALLPVTASLLYLLGWRPWGMDPVPVFLALSGVLIAIALLGLNLFDLIPAARALALDRVSIALLVLDSDGVVRDCNESAQDLPGLSGLRIGQRLPHGTPLADKLAEVAVESGGNCEFTVADPHAGPGAGGVRHYRVMSYAVSSADHITRGVALVVQDISQAKEQLVVLTQQATTDALTGALTRRAVTQRAKQALSDAHLAQHSVAVLMVDMDRFKEINDRYGHAAGDEALAAASLAMRSVLRAQDQFGRWGGDEFVIVLPDAELDAALQIAHRLQDRLSAANRSGSAYELRASVGVAVGVPGPSDEMRTYLAIADRALYRAKKHGESGIEVAQLASA